jgi:glyoxylase-like metal-dependent hydrolase (beta-lactamase superfamily II)
MDGVFRHQVGEVGVHVLSDGELPGGIVSIDGIADEAIVQALHEAGGVTPISVNTFLIESGGRMALVDGGGGGLYAPLGKLWNGLALLELEPRDVDTLLLTHMHPDHIGAYLDSEGRAVFPQAELVMAEAELSFWQTEANRGRVAERVRPWFDLAAKVLSAYRGRIRTFSGGEVFPHVEALPLPGHTPGHSGYTISHGGDALVIWGDVMHRPDLQTPFPEGKIAFDIDPDQAVTTRKRTLDRLAADGSLIAGMHLHFPSLHRIERKGTGYRLVSATDVQPDTE